jgi:hypothetical protein
MAEGIEGLTRDKTRKPGKQPLPTATVERVVELTLRQPSKLLVVPQRAPIVLRQLSAEAAIARLVLAL